MSECVLDIGRGEKLVLPSRPDLIGGISIPRVFSSPDRHPYDDVVWVRKRIEILDFKTGGFSFERDHVEVPASWGEQALRITASKYLFGNRPEDLEYEDSFRHPFDRIANTYTVWGWKNGYFASTEDAVAFNHEVKAMLVRQIWAPNSPVWFNIGHWEQWRWGRPDLRPSLAGRGNLAFKAKVGTDGKLTVEEMDNHMSTPQASACFLTEIEDSMEAILHHQVVEGRIFASGSGVGINLSPLRSSNEPIAGKGRSSGPIAFDKGWDRMAGAIKSGGKTRRAARMVIMDSSHPDIFSFIDVKASQDRIAKVVLREHNTLVNLRALALEKIISGSPDEQLAAAAVLEIPEITSSVYGTGMDDEVYSETVAHQNANHTVSLLADFWEAFYLRGSYATRWVTRPDKIQASFRADQLLRAMANSCYEVAEPGAHNNDWINLWSPYKSVSRLNTSNPCITGTSLVAGVGLRTIESMVGDYPRVVCGDGILRNALKVFPTGIQPVFRMITENGYSIDATPNHLFSTVDGVDVPLSDLNESHRVLLGKSEFGTLTVDPGCAYIAGALCAAGRYHNGSYFLPECDLDIAESLNEFGCVPVDGKWQASSTLFSNHCLTDEAFLLDEEGSASLLRGFFDFGASTLDHSSARLQVLLLSFGIKSKRTHDGSLTISPYSMPVFSKKIGSLSSAKRFQQESFIHENKYENEDFTESPSVKLFVGSAPVFDISEVSTNHFVANGFVIHNCSEYIAPNNTSCNLSSFNALKFLKSGVLDFDLLKAGALLAMIVADLNVEEGGFPIPEIAYGTYRYRTTGIGFANVGGLIMSLGFPYDSDQGRLVASALFSALSASCWDASAKLGRAFGHFYDSASVIPELRKVHALHLACSKAVNLVESTLSTEDIADVALDGLNTPSFASLDGRSAVCAFLKAFDRSGPLPQVAADLIKKSLELWENVCKEEIFRNSFVTCTAPTGTISGPLGIFDSGTTSAEPDYCLVKTKFLSGGGFLRMFNSLALHALDSLGYSQVHIRDAALEVAGVSALIDACSGDSIAAAEHLSHCTLPAGPVRLAWMKSGEEPLETCRKALDPMTPPSIVFSGSKHVEEIPWLSPSHLPVFDCAVPAGQRSISHQGHLRMLAAIQPFISGATSKTINLPSSATRDDIFDCYVSAHSLGVKCIAIYRNGSKGVSVFVGDSPDDRKWDTNIVWQKITGAFQTRAAAIYQEAAKPFRRRLPGVRDGKIVKFDISGQLDGFLQVGFYPDGSCGEVFGRLGQGGSFAHGMFDAFCKAFSTMLQWGVPLPMAIKSFRSVAFDPSGFAKVGDPSLSIPIRGCKSVVDLMMLILEWLFPEENNYKIIGSSSPPLKIDNLTVTPPQDHLDNVALSAAEMCPVCHSLSMIQDGACRRCSSCGYSGGGCGG